MTPNDVETAVITGGSSGIGLCITQTLVAAGHRVVNLARRRVPIDDERITNFDVDLSDRTALDSVCEGLKDSGARLFVHNAGVIRPDLITEVDIDDLEYLNQIHLGAGIQIAQALVPRMKTTTFGRIVLISSRASVGMATRTSYSATKAGQIAMARTWALELAEFGITVNTVAPGPIEATEMFHDVVPQDSPKLTALAAKVPVKRLGRPEDVARAVMFFLSSESSFITGQNLFVCGGTSIG